MWLDNNLIGTQSTENSPYVFSSSTFAYMKVTLGFADPATLDSNPGWPLRNLLMLAAQQWYVYVHGYS